MDKLASGPYRDIRPKRVRAASAIANDVERASLRPLANRITGWQSHAAHLIALAAACHDEHRARSARQEALSLAREVENELEKLQRVPRVGGASGSHLADVRKALIALASRLRAV